MRPTGACRRTTKCHAKSLISSPQECGVTGSRIMGGGFGGCTINLVKAELYDAFIEKAKTSFAEKYGHEPIVIPVIISDGARKLA